MEPEPKGTGTKCEEVEENLEEDEGTSEEA
jgi:hypothetical protein